MRTKVVLCVVAALGLLLMASATASAGDRGLSSARSATAPFHELATAQAAGYTVEVIDLNHLACIDDVVGHTGGMGIHFLNPQLLDGNVDAAAPELVIYEPTANGRMRLVAVEYLVLKSAWEAAHGGPAAAPPSLFGQQFESVAAGNRYGLPDFYELHAWIWKHNSLGMHNDWNPAVSCAYAP